MWSHRTTKSNTLQGYVTPVMNSEMGYFDMSMERHFNIYSNIWRCLRIIDNIFNILKKMKISLNELKISSNNWIIEDIFKLLNKC